LNNNVNPKVDEVVDKAFQKHRDHNPPKGGLIMMLQEVQSELGYLPREALEKTSNLMSIPLTHVYGVATFYHHFRLRPKGKHVISLCSGTACHVQGSGELISLLRKNLDLKEGEDTTKDGLFTIVQVRCLGACGLAPVMKIDETYYGKLSSSGVSKSLNAYRRALNEPDGSML
jgi:NADH-quinone oxidoreductase subunit E